ncbi:YlmH family RNA-binding protein [Paenibacillus abyssi]|uniref:RNA-binding protein YlmH n=1 Tax=Paenibacillus abyssi TaxID=1340531 RepID=A0A917FUH4_9BACL|nr:YlmH/Sll1252 family protein [Paenibacillus abyssi]GGG10114.1 putative RNA-binding protein YlmH [Paenibacillus abyssi]
MINSEIYEHFHPDERAFVDRASEWVERAAEWHELKRTDFLDPRQAFIVTTLVNRHPDAALRLDGGYTGAERQRAIIAPDYRPLDEEPIGISVLSVHTGDRSQLELDHGDYMGAILGLGIKRDRIGDIHVHEDGCHCLVADEIADYLNIHLRQVHRVHVLTDILPQSELRTAVPELEEMNFTVASLRLDGISSDVYRISRAKIVDPIRAGRCRVNWKVVEDPSKLLKAGDVVSMQGLGRFKVLDVEGMTKKGRIRVKVGKFI